MKTGFFVALEGPEGSGKTTQGRLLAGALEDQGYTVLLTREPGGTQIGERLRDLLLGPSGRVMLAETEALLFAAARSQHVREAIAPALAAGKVVICDRFTDSSLAYQGGGRGLDMGALRTVQCFATGGLVPDLRVLLDLPVEIGLSRRHAGREVTNHLDHAEVSFHEKVRAKYHELVHEDPGAWCVVDATKDADVLCREIAEAVRDRMVNVGLERPARIRSG
ncbi:MAG TPA: dTMP kinase [Thermomicrobiales bacterium]|nr:dTMP kinase [Thermomicrobiales bacterium]